MGVKLNCDRLMLAAVEYEFKKTGDLSILFLVIRLKHLDTEGRRVTS